MTNETQIDNERKMQYAVVHAPFDIAKKKLEQKGYHIPSLAEIARLYIQEGRKLAERRLVRGVEERGGKFKITREKTDDNQLINRTWLSEAIVYDPSNGLFLTKNSPIIKEPERAANCYLEGNCFFLSPEQVDLTLKDSIKLDLDTTPDKSVPLDQFLGTPLARFAFENHTESFGKYLHKKRVKVFYLPRGNLNEMQEQKRACALPVEIDPGTYYKGGGNLSISADPSLGIRTMRCCYIDQEYHYGDKDFLGVRESVGGPIREDLTGKLTPSDWPKYPTGRKVRLINCLPDLILDHL